MCFQHGGTLEWRKCKDDKRFIEVRKVKETRKKETTTRSRMSATGSGKLQTPSALAGLLSESESEERTMPEDLEKLLGVKNKDKEKDLKALKDKEKEQKALKDREKEQEKAVQACDSASVALDQTDKEKAFTKLTTAMKYASATEDKIQKKIQFGKMSSEMKQLGSKIFKSLRAITNELTPLKSNLKSASTATKAKKLCIQMAKLIKDGEKWISEITGDK